MGDDEGTRRILLAPSSARCALPPQVLFESLHPRFSNVRPQRPGDAAHFASHTCCRVPIDNMCGAGKAHSAGSSTCVHRFQLLQPAAELLNQRLVQQALEAERTAEGRRCSNSGGYQSGHFPLSTYDEQLQAVVNAAINELIQLPDAALDETDALGEGPSSGSAHEGIAWWNVNRAGDFNAIHVHDPKRWSGVYFVASGGQHATPAGHLLFRGGRGSPSATDDSTHAFVAVAPEPGSLWLFPGSLPHCVLSFGRADGARSVAGGRRPRGEAAGARISFAVNMLAEAPAHVETPPENRAL